MELLPLVCLCLLSCSGDAVRVLVKEDRDAVLPCSPNPKVDLTGQVFDWKKDGEDVFMHYSDGKTREGPDFIGRVSHFQDQLKNGNASIKIRKTKMADNGTYSCYFPHLQSQTSIIELVVGAAPKPYIFILDGTTYWSLLQCEAHGTPLPTLEWQDSANKTLHAEESQVSEREGRTYVTLNITVAKTGRYRCVATQETLSHQISTEIPVSLQGAASKPYVTTVETDEGRMLQCEVLGASPKPKVEWKDSSGKILQAEKPKVTKSGDSYDIVLRAALTKTDNFRCVVTQEGSSSPLSAEIHAVTGSNTGAIAAIAAVVAVVFTLIAVGVFLYCLVKKGRITLNLAEVEKKIDGENPDPADKTTELLTEPGSTPVAANGQAEGGQCDLDTL